MTTATITVNPPVTAALEVLSQLPKNSSWDDVMYHLYVREKVERGDAQIEAGQFRDAEEVFADLLGEDDDE